MSVEIGRFAENAIIKEVKAGAAIAKAFVKPWGRLMERPNRQSGREAGVGLRLLAGKVGSWRHAIVSRIFAEIDAGKNS